MLKGLADLSGTIMQAQMTEEVLSETATEAITKSNGVTSATSAQRLAMCCETVQA